MLTLVKNFHDILDDKGEDILHGRLVFNKQKKLERFSLNYVTTIKTGKGVQEKKVEVVRYDCSHGELHMHRAYRKPPTIEKIYKAVSIEAVKELTIEIRDNWQTWKRALIINSYGGE